LEPLGQGIGYRGGPGVGDSTIGKPLGEDLRLFTNTVVCGIPLELVQEVFQFEGERPEIFGTFNCLAD
jgi:hypothetical protein